MRRKRKTRSPEKMLAHLFSRTLETETGCLEWRGARLSEGYGRVSWRGVKWLAHRLSYYLFHGTIPDGHMVMHQCDNPSCINPHHLSTGTAHENNVDRDAKGRTARGESSNAVLTAEQVRRIRATPDLCVAQAAKALQVSASAIKHALHGRTWGHL